MENKAYWKGGCNGGINYEAMIPHELMRSNEQLAER